jgi:hypothetical protein
MTRFHVLFLILPILDGRQFLVDIPVLHFDELSIPSSLYTNIVLKKCIEIKKAIH